MRSRREGFGNLVRINYIDPRQLKEMKASWCNE